MTRELADAETPFTDFRVVDCDGLPQAVFDGLPAEQSSLLSYFLYPDKTYVGGLYLDLLKVTEGEIEWMSYEDDFFRTTFTPENVVLETKESTGQTSSVIRMNLSPGEVKFLLLKWTFECMRWGAIRHFDESVTRF